MIRSIRAFRAPLAATRAHLLLSCAFTALVISLTGCGDSNQAPQASSARLDTNEDQPVSGSLTASDPDGDTLTLRLGTPPSQGDVTLTGGMGFTYTPRPDANGTDSFSLMAVDPKGKSATATITVGVAPIQDSPAIAATLSLDEDTSAIADLVRHPDGQQFTVEVITPPSHGLLSAEATAGRFRYMPAPDFNGADTVVLTAQDAMGLSSTRTVAITVRPVNDAPIASADAAVLLQGTTFRIDPRINDYDVDGDPMEVEVANLPEGWVATARGDGALDVTPPATFVGGPLTMNYRVRDPGGLSSASTVTLSVAFTNGVLMQVAEDLWYADGVRKFRVSAPLRPGEVLYTFDTARSAPVVFYRTRTGTVHHLFRIDLRNPEGVLEIESPVAYPGVGEAAYSDDGMRVMYVYEGRYKFIDFAASTVPVDRGVAEDGLILGADGTRAYFRGLRTQQPYTFWGALFSKTTLDAAPVQQITSTVAPGDGVGRVLAVSRDGRRLFYNVDSSGELMIADPLLPGSERPFLNGATDPIVFMRMTEDEDRFLGTCTVGEYCLVSMQGAIVDLTSGTGTEFIAASALSGDGSVFAYSRATAPGPGYVARLYSVDTANPVPVPVADGLPPSTVGYTLGVTSVHMSRNGRTLLFTTTEMVPFGGSGSYVPGNGRLYVMDPTVPGSWRTLRQVPENVTAWGISPDGTMAVFGQSFPTTVASVHAVNLLNPSQILLLGLDSSAARLVRGFASQSN